MDLPAHPFCDVYRYRAGKLAADIYQRLRHRYGLDMADEIWQLVSELETYAIDCGEMLDVAIGKVRGESPLQKLVAKLDRFDRQSGKREEE